MDDHKPSLPYGAVAAIGGITVFAKDTLSPNVIELRDRYGLLIGTMNKVASISIGKSKE